MDQTAETAAKPAYKRILLKLSGEALMGEDWKQWTDQAR